MATTRNKALKNKRQTSNKSLKASAQQSDVGSPESPVSPLEQQGVLLQTQEYSGPLPVPEHFARYEKVLPGAAERILRMAEMEQQKRNDLVEKDNAQVHIEYKRGQWIGLFVVLAALGVVAFGLFHDQGWPAFGLGSITILSLMTGYIFDALRKK